MTDSGAPVHDPDLVLVELTVDELEVMYRALVERWLRIEHANDHRAERVAEVRAAGLGIGAALARHSIERHDYESARTLSARIAVFLVDRRAAAQLVEEVAP